MGDFIHEQPQDGDLYVLEVRAGRFTIHRWDGESWEQLGAGHSEQDIQTLIAPMQFLGESKGFRRYYRPTGTSEPTDRLEVEKIAAANGGRYRLRFHGQIMTVDAQALRDLTDWGLLHMRELEQEALPSVFRHLQLAQEEGQHEKPETSYLDDPTRVSKGWLGEE